MLIITRRYVSATTKRVYERAATAGFTSFADEAPSRTGECSVAFTLEYSPFPLSFAFAFSSLSLSLFFFTGITRYLVDNYEQATQT